MKNLFSILLGIYLLSFCQFLLAQENTVDQQNAQPIHPTFKNRPLDYSVHPLPTIGDDPLTVNELPDGCNATATKYVRVNIHWMLNSAGQGNFRESDDGNGSTTVNGYTRAEYLIEAVNDLLNNNQRNWLSPAGTFTEPIRVQLVLEGVYFHRDDRYYGNGTHNSLYNWSIINDYGVNASNTYNLFMINKNISTSGVANSLGGAGIKASKVYNDWDMYKQFGTWTTARRIIPHELGHLWNLYHAWGNDYCQDTNPHNNCWELNPNDPNCDTWPEISNNLMDYNKFEPFALTPNQITRVHNTLNGPQSTYVRACDGCMPANAFFSVPAKACPSEVIMDGRGSWNEDNHFIEIFEVSGVGSTAAIAGTYYSRWFAGEIDRVNLKTYCNYNFQWGKTYRIKLAVQNYNRRPKLCTTWDETVHYVQTYSKYDVRNPCFIVIDQGWPTPRRQGESVSQLGGMIQPNPAHDRTFLALDLPANATVQVALFDMHGQQVHHLAPTSMVAGTHRIPLEVAQLTPGIYFCKVRTTTEQLTLRLMVQ